MASLADLFQHYAPKIERAREMLRPHNVFDTAIVFWRGTSGHAYIHTIYSLRGCPELPAASVMLVHHSGYNRRVVLDVIAVDHEEPTLNLAEIRRTGATIGANEVHVHFASGNRDARHNAAFDLKARHGCLDVVGV
jgi:hypothetical protein